MSTVKSSNEHLTFNADGTAKNILFQSNGTQKASISSAGLFTSSTIDATVLTGNLPALNGSALTNLPVQTTDISGKLSLSGGAMSGTITNFTSTGIDDNADSNAITIDSSERIGFGTTSPLDNVQIGSANPIGFNGNYPDIHFNSYQQGGAYRPVTTNFAARLSFHPGTGKLTLKTSASSISAGSNYNGVEIFSVDKSGNLAVTGTTTSSSHINTTGQIFLNTVGTNYINAKTAFWMRFSDSSPNYEKILEAEKDSFVKLFHNGTEKIATTSTGIGVTGNIVVSGTVDGVDVAAANTLASAALPKAGYTGTTILHMANAKYQGGDVASGARMSLKYLGSDPALRLFGGGSSTTLELKTGNNSSNYAIKVIDENSLATVFSVRKDGGAETSGIYDMHLTGKITSAQPSFSAGLTGGSGAGELTSWHVNTNVGSHFSSGRFTAPVAGRYHVSFFAMTTSNQTVDVELKVNGSSTHDLVPYAGPTGASYIHVAGSAVITLAANDYISMYSNGATFYTTSTGRHSQFSGFLIG